MDVQVKIFETPYELFENSANLISELINEFIESSGKCTFVLSGGSTPKSLYEDLAKKNNISWEKVYFFWGDERCVPPDNDESNYRIAYETLLSKINVPSKNIIRVMTEMPHSFAALDYEKRLRDLFPGEKFPSFDIVLLGLGEDGHTASLFERSEGLQKIERWVTDNYIEMLKKWRITLTLPVINNSKNVIFLVSGKNKANIVKSIVSLKDTNLLASQINPIKGNLTWYLDREAASLIR